jgi:transcriptional regulator with XRE-family HTH domain
MKRKLTRHNPIRHLRECLDFTQKEFAERYKLTARQIQVMELGKGSVPQELARRWARDYGVDADWMRRPFGFARMVNGKRLTPALIEAWKDIQSISTEDRERAVTQALSQLNAILRTIPAKRLPGLLAELGNTFEAIVKDKDYRLESAISKYRESIAITYEPKWMSIGEINANAFCHRSPIWKKACSRYSFSPDEFAVVTERHVPLWKTLGPEIKSGYRVEVTVEVRKRKHTFAFERTECVAISAVGQPLKIPLPELAG